MRKTRARRIGHEAVPAAARLRVFLRRFPRGDARLVARPETETVPRALARAGAESVAHGALLAGVDHRQRGHPTQPGELPEGHQEDTHHARAGHRRAVRVPDVHRHGGHHRVPGAPAVAVRRPGHQRVLLRPVPAAQRGRRLAVLHRVRRRLLRRLRVRHVLRRHHLQVSPRPTVLFPRPGTTYELQWHRIPTYEPENTDIIRSCTPAVPHHCSIQSRHVPVPAFSAFHTGPNLEIFISGCNLRSHD